MAVKGLGYKVIVAPVNGIMTRVPSPTPIPNVAYILRTLANSRNIKVGQYGLKRIYLPYGLSDSYVAHIGFTPEHHKKARALAERYSRFCNWVDEGRFQWQTVDTIHFADNSIEHVQVNKFGETRRVMSNGPSGDVCF